MTPPITSPSTVFRDEMTARAAAKGVAAGTVDTVNGILFMSQDTVQYLLGADRHWAERAPFWSNVFRQYDGWADPAWRIVHFINTSVYGGINMVAGGAPYKVFNEWLGWDIPYLAPPPRNWRELGQSLSGTVAISLSLQAGRALHAEVRAAKALERVAQEVDGGRQAALVAWAQKLGPQDLQHTLYNLQEAVQSVPHVKKEWVTTELARGTAAMQDLETLSSHLPQAKDWLHHNARSLVIALTNQLAPGPLSIREAVMARLRILIRHDPEGVAWALVDRILKKDRLSDVTPHFALLKEIGGYPPHQRMVLGALRHIASTTRTTEIAREAAHGMLRLLPEMEQEMALTIISAQFSRGAYVLTEELLHRGGHPSSRVLTQALQLAPIDLWAADLSSDTPANMMTVARDLAALGNAPAFTMLESVAREGVPRGPMALESLLDLGRIPEHGSRLHGFLRSFDTSAIEQAIRHNLPGDPEQAARNVRFLGSLSAAGSPGALDALVRISLQPDPAHYVLGAEALADLALKNAMTLPEVEMILRDPKPRLIPFLHVWAVRQPETLIIHPEAFVQAVRHTKMVPADAMYIVGVMARQNHPETATIIQRLLPYAKEAEGVLLQIAYDNDVRIAGRRRDGGRGGTGRGQRPVRTTEVDIARGREAAFARRILEGGQIEVTPTDLQELANAANRSVPDALDALYKVAREGGSQRQLAGQLIALLARDIQHPHGNTARIMMGTLQPPSTAATRFPVK